jgi:hypothetical protein
MSLEQSLADARAEVTRTQACAAALGLALPTPPEQLDISSCCGRGCHPCMFTYYFDALERWREEAKRRLGTARADRQ